MQPRGAEDRGADAENAIGLLSPRVSPRSSASPRLHLYYADFEDANSDVLPSAAVAVAVMEVPPARALTVKLQFALPEPLVLTVPTARSDLPSPSPVVANSSRYSVVFAFDDTVPLIT